VLIFRKMCSLLCLRFLRGTVATKRKCDWKLLHQVYFGFPLRSCARKNCENRSIFV